MKLEVDECKLVEEFGRLMQLYCQAFGLDFHGFYREFHELCWRVYIPCKARVKSE